MLYSHLPCFLIIFIIGTLSSADKLDTHDHDWDVLIFTQHWPVTVCLQWKEKLPQHSCIFPSLRNIWTVHGIWPSKLGTIGPQFCNSSWHFDASQLQPIEQQLEQYWTNIQNGSLYKLWKHEWQKHGTCAAVLPSLNSENKYFSQGLQWINQYDMANILAKADIIPNPNGYNPQEVWDAVTKVLQKNPRIECVIDPKTGESYLFEIRICFNKELQLVDCDGIKSDSSMSTLGGIKTNCQLNKPAMYPSVLPKSTPTTTEQESPPFRAPWLLTVLKVIRFLQWFTL